MQILFKNISGLLINKFILHETNWIKIIIYKLKPITDREKIKICALNCYLTKKNTQ